MHVTPTKHPSPAEAPSIATRIIRFHVCASGADSVERVIPLRCEPASTTVGEVVSALVTRLESKGCRLGSGASFSESKQVRLGSGPSASSRSFALNLDLNAEDALECYLEAEDADCRIDFIAGSKETMAPRPLTIAAAEYASRLDFPQKEENGGATVRSAADGVIITPHPPAMQRRAASPEVTTDCQITEPRPPPSRGPSGDRPQRAPRPQPRHSGSRPTTPADNKAASTFKMTLLLNDCTDEESTCRRELIDEEAAAGNSLAERLRRSAEHATSAGLLRLETAHHVRSCALEASYDDTMAQERKRFSILRSAIEEEGMRSPSRPVHTAIANFSLRANKAHFIDSMEQTGRREVQTEELEERNRISEDLLLFATRDIVRNDARVVAMARLLISDEATARAHIDEVGMRKLGMFQRQCAAGKNRLAGTQ